MNTAHIINELINKGEITFNPFNMSTTPKRYSVPLDMETLTFEIQNHDIKELMTDLIIQAEQNPPHPVILQHKDNIFIDIYAFDTFAEVNYEITFDQIADIKKFKKENNIKTIYYLMANLTIII